MFGSLVFEREVQQEDVVVTSGAVDEGPLSFVDWNGLKSVP